MEANIQQDIDNQTLFDNACQMIRAGKRAEAIPLLRQVIAEEPTDPLALHTLSSALAEERQFEEAISLTQRALSVTPHDGGMWCALGGYYGYTGQWDKSRECHDKALYFCPDLPSAHWNRSMHRLMVGDFTEGWQEYQWGRVTLHKRVRTLKPEWDGSFTPERLFVWCEQGFGDTLMFLQLLARLRGRYPETQLLLEVQRELIPLLSCQPFLQGVELQDIDRYNAMPLGVTDHVGLLTLPAVLELQLEDLPLATEYIRAPIETERDRSAKEFRVGICWKGNPEHGNAWQRDIPEEAILPLAEVEGIEWVCLQKNTLMHSFFHAKTYAMPSWAETANVIDSLDLVITCDTGVGHLAGAMGVPTWIMVPFVSDYRWLLNRTDSPWYPETTLFRQEKRGNWQRVIEAVSKALAKRARLTVTTHAPVGGQNEP